MNRGFEGSDQKTGGKCVKEKKIILIAEYGIVAVFLILCAGLLFFSRNENEEGNPKKKIVSLYMTMNNPYFEVINEEIKTVVESRGDILETRDCSMDAAMQAELVENFVKEGVDCILINVVDWKKIDNALKKAKEAEIPVIAVDTLVYNTALVDGTVVSDNYQAGVECAQDLMKRRKSGKVLFLVQSENKSAIDRIQGFQDTLEKADWKYENVGELECKGQLEIAQPLVENILKKRKDIDVVMALNDPSAMGAMAALDAEDMLSDVLVYGVDGTPEAKRMISENKMTATAAQSPQTTGKKTVEMLYNILEGKDSKRHIVIPVKFIQKKNVKEYGLTGWQ